MKKNRMVFIALIACVLVGTGIFFSLGQFPTVAASTGFGLDSSCYGFGSVKAGTSVTTSSITATSNELIIIVITGSTTSPNNPTASITDSLSTHLSYTERGNDGGSTTVTACNILEYYTLTSTSFSGSPFTITVTMSSSANYNVQVFGITGENTVTPFDTHITAGSSQWNGHNSNVDPVSPSYSTNNARDIILGLEGDTDTSAETVATGFTAASYMLNDVNSLGNNAEYKMVTSTQSGQTVSFGTAAQAHWVIIVDAVQEASPSVSLSPTSGIVGAQVSVSGSNFAASSTLTVKFGSTTVTLGGMTSTDANGAFIGATFTVLSGKGADSVAGSHIITVTDASSNSGTTSFTIAPSISISPSCGHSTTTVTVSGNGFASASRITVKFNSVTQTTSPTTVTTDSSGSIPSSVTFSVPTIADGTYTVTATDAHTPANTASSTFIVDTVAPSVSITAPTSSQYFKISSVGASGTASDAGSGIVSVQVKVDSGSYVAATGTTSWSYSSFTGISDGSHTITALATDNAGNTKTATVTFTVDTVAPTSSATALSTYQTSASFAVSYSSNDAASGVANVHLWVETPGASSYIDLGVWTTGHSYTATAGDGLYKFYTVAADNAGNVESAPVAADASTTPDTGLQSLAISSPTDGTTLNTATVTISGTASDTTSGLQKVEVQIDSSSTWNLASTSDSFADWSYQTTLADGSHTITAKATDNAGNTETTSVTFTVQTIVETQLTVKITPTTYNKDEPQTLTIKGTLTDANSNPLADQPITLWYDQGTPQNWIQIDPKATISTDANGVYSYDWTTLPSNLANGFYVIEARFALNSPYQSTFADTSTPGNGDSLNVLPEYAFGALAALGACLVGFVVFKKRSSLSNLNSTYKK